MTSLAERLGVLARSVGQVLSLPTKALAVIAGGVLVITGLLAVGFITRPTTGAAATVVVIVIWVLLALPVVMLARRRRKWLDRTEQAATTHQVILPGPAESSEVIPADLTSQIYEDMHGQPGQEDVQVLFEAFTESRAPEPSRGAGARVTRVFSMGRLAPIGRALGSVERAQRALLTAAGGTAGAPYLKDDLRLTIASFLGTLVAIPLAALTGIVLALILLTQ
ncbi:MAG TPA: hypothetical protein VK063_04695 [Beutenbergiaceae bacterium]|nr:hypothetical protein [Beutenbergiaceae bacterium]